MAYWSLELPNNQVNFQLDKILIRFNQVNVFAVYFPKFSFCMQQSHMGVKS